MSLSVVPSNAPNQQEGVPIRNGDSSSEASNGLSNGAHNDPTSNPGNLNGTSTSPSNIMTKFIDDHELMPIAIVGMSCRLPGNVTTPEEFWEMCARARSGWSKVPKERFNHEAFHHPNPDKSGCYNPQGGHFLTEDVGLFDAPFFNITEKEAVSMDPQQRLLLETTFEAMENAGLPKHSLAGKDVGVFVGSTFADYEVNNVRDLETAPMYQATGCAPSILANRISYYFDFQGPSIAIDSACSSSLAALHFACQSLRNGESSHAIVASARLNLLPEFFVTMSMSSLFSNEGRSFAFDERGSGFGRGEGAGCVVLKPLDEALKANDPIRAVVVGSGVNQDGKTKGMTMPSGEAQEGLIRSVYEKSGLDPTQTGFVEAHGTGTKVGDPIEASALHNVFGKGRTPRQPLYIGSVKSNIGHLEVASGIVSLIKSAMMLEKGFILPNYDFGKPNPKIPFADWNFKVPKTQRPWPRDKKYISVNNFGFGGTNTHCVLERAPQIPTALVDHKNPIIVKDEIPRLYLLSANDKTALESLMQNLTVYLEQRPEVFQSSLMSSLAYTLGQRRSVMPWKIAIPAISSYELITKLSSSATIPFRSTKEPRIGLVFTGQGAQWHAMGRELMGRYDIFSTIMEKVDQCLVKFGANFSIIDELSKDSERSIVSEAHISQPACTATQIALTALISSWGIRPVAVAGHSSGEIAAAYAAGILDLESCMAIAYHRGQAIVSLKRQFPHLKGAMLAVGGSPEEIQPMIKLLKSEGKARIACFNSPFSITASGDEDAIDELQIAIESKQMFNRKLRVDVGYHSHHMNLVAEEYIEAIKEVSPQKSTEIAFHSSLLGKLTDGTSLGPLYWSDNLTCPVRFSEALQSMCTPPQGNTAPNVDVLIELGPHSALEGPVKQILKEIGGNATKIAYAPSLIRNKDAIDTLLQLGATMCMKGTNLDFSKINVLVPGSKLPVVLTDLPRYSWNHSIKYWHNSRLSEKHQHQRFPRNDLVGRIANYSNDLEPTWRNIINSEDMPWVRDHKMQSMSVYPLAGFIAMALEAVSQRAAERNVIFDRFQLREVTISRPMVIQEGSNVEANIALRPHAEGTRTSSDLWDEFRVFSWASDRGWIEHCRGLISVESKATKNAVNGEQITQDAKHLLASRISSIDNASTTPVDAKVLYENLEAVGVGYGPTFQGLESCRASDHHAVGELIVPNTQAVMPLEHEPAFIIHPAFLDQFIQIVWPIFGAGRTGLDLLYMPSFLKSMSISTGITTKSGDRLKVYGSGSPTPSNPHPTKFSMFAVSPENAEEALITMDALVMTPVSDADSGADITSHRNLCYKMEWEALEMGKITDVDSPPPFDLDIAIICDETQNPLAWMLQEVAGLHTSKKPIVGKLGEIDPSGKICIVLLEVDEPFIANLKQSSFELIQKLITTSSGIIWPVRGAYSDSKNPNANMISGMARSIRSESLLKFATLDLSISLPNSGVVEIICRVLKDVFISNTAPVGLNLEYQEREGNLSVPRVVNDPAMNKIVHQETQYSSTPELQPFNQISRPLKIAIQTPGALDTLYFVDDLAVGTPLPEYEVEIEVKATSMNFKDIMISMGQLNSKYIGVECSGVISAVGSKVTDLAVGDRVCAMSEGAYATYTRCRGTSVQKIPHSMSFEDAATIPVIYCTAYYSLFDLAHLSRGEKVLIHAAAGGVGQAAILLAQVIGAEIFATVGSIAKKEHLMTKYGIPEDHIFFSRDISFAKAIMRATNDEGVDVILNSLAGNALRESWDCLAHFGRFIEIGKRDITGNSRLEMATFEYNAMFASVDLTLVAAERPKLMKRLLVDVFDLMSKGSIRPISPITIFPISEVESAFRTLQSGKIMGKIVIVAGPNDKVRASLPKSPTTILKSDATYIIIGGTGGLGCSMSRWMIGKGAKHIVLLSRNGSTEGKVGELIRDAKASGAEIVVRACDVAKKDEVETLVNRGLSGMPPIRGVIHAAMVLRDTLFEKMTWDQWAEVVSAKVFGSWNFHYALSTIELDFFVALSSVAGTVGNRGQSAYAAANTFLDGFVQYRISQGLKASSIALTAVSDVGYLASNAEKAAQVAQNLGDETISEVEVLALLGAAINGRISENCNNHCITGLNVGRTGDHFWLSDGKFTPLRLAAAEAQEDISAAPIVSLGSAVKAAKSYEQALQLVCDGIMTKVSAVLMVPKEEMDASRAIVVYGLDSLVAIEIRNWITRELEASLQVLELLTSSSISSLAGLILKKSKIVRKEILEAETAADGVVG
ncbi:hypothetical protein B7494_g6244 [Chlorociboria aeruginascens]|nr:hypothetical protein B7494_g6244 [Chlorociboria aeruginascens]